jgi:hypothetical protein
VAGRGRPHLHREPVSAPSASTERRLGEPPILWAQNAAAAIARSRPPDARRRHRHRPRLRRRNHAGCLGRLRRALSPGLGLDAGLRELRHPPRLPSRAGDPVHRLRRLPRPRLASHLRGWLLGAPPHLLGLALLRQQQPLPSLRMGHGVPNSAIVGARSALTASAGGEPRRIEAARTRAGSSIAVRTRHGEPHLHPAVRVEVIDHEGDEPRPATASSTPASWSCARNAAARTTVGAGPAHQTDLAGQLECRRPRTSSSPC